jgi:hypothetical protein
MKEQDNSTLFDIIKENPNMTYNEATKVLEGIRLKKEVGACITAGMKRDRDATDKMKKTKLIPMTEEEEYRNAGITKAEIGMNSPEMKEAKERIKELQIRLAEALEVDEAHQKQMGKLQVRLTEVEEDNQKLAHQVEDLKLNGVRKAGL